jgi:hypothetical protein
MRLGAPIAMKTKWAPHPVALWGRQSWRQPPFQAAFYRLSKSLLKGRLPPKLWAAQESLPSMFSISVAACLKFSDFGFLPLAIRPILC